MKNTVGFEINLLTPALPGEIIFPDKRWGKQVNFNPNSVIYITKSQLLSVFYGNYPWNDVVSTVG